MSIRKCNCDGNTCPNCDAGFKVYYREQLENIRVWLKENNQIDASPHDFLDGRDAWYEYCTLCNEDLLEKEAVPVELFNLKESWI
jgi:hypothetical protein